MELNIFDPEDSASAHQPLPKILPDTPSDAHSSDHDSRDAQETSRQSEPASFKDLNIVPAMLAVLSIMGIQEPTVIQRRAIPLVMQGRNTVGIARTGSGKTLCFALPILQSLLRDPFGVHTLVITPTRELAFQIEEQINAFALPLGLKAACLTGGTAASECSALLSYRPHILIATPGRLAYSLRTSEAQTALRRLRYLVLDEADRLLSGDREFNEQLTAILRCAPPCDRRVTLFFTATMSENIRAFLSHESNRERFAVVETIDSDLLLVRELDQRFLRVPDPMYKPMWLLYLLSCISGIDVAKRYDGKPMNTRYIVEEVAGSADAPEDADADANADGSEKAGDPAAPDDPSSSSDRDGQGGQGGQDIGAASAHRQAGRKACYGCVKSIIVFVDTVENCSTLDAALRRMHMPVTALHATLSMAERRRNLTAFRKLQARILVTTDLASRGIDIDTVDLVINYDVPADPTTFVHRQGRVCRAGRPGSSLTFVEPSDQRRLRAIEVYTRRALLPLRRIVDKTNRGRASYLDEARVIDGFFATASRLFKEARLQIMDWGLGENLARRASRRRRTGAGASAGRGGEPADGPDGAPEDARSVHK